MKHRFQIRNMRTRTPHQNAPWCGLIAKSACVTNTALYRDLLNYPPTSYLGTCDVNLNQQGVTQPISGSSRG